MAVTRHNSPADDEDQDAGDGIFTIDGRPVYFYLYGTNEPESSWALSEGQREDLQEKITQHGGSTCKRPNDADTIIVNAHGLFDLRKKYDFERHIYVELPSFVNRCISQRQYRHEPVQKRALGGRPPGRARMNFTTEDDMHLCRFIALHMPEVEAGGRLGIKPYQELVEKAQYDDLNYRWAARHPAESWRERYKTQRARLDPIIEDLVEQNPPPDDGKGVRPFDRRYNEKARLARLFALAQEEEEGENEFEPRVGHRNRSEPLEGGGKEGENEFEDDGLDELEPTPEPQEHHAPPAPRSRHTLDVVEQRIPRAQSRAHSAPFSAPEWHTRAPSQESNEFASDLSSGLLSELPGPDDAGPSRAQNAPGPSSAPLLGQRVHSGPGQASQVPMSSQMTLVGPVPTQLRGAAGAAKLPSTQGTSAQARAQEDDPAEPEKRPNKKRRIRGAPGAQDVPLEPLRDAGTGRRAAQAARNAKQAPPVRIRSGGAAPAPRQAPAEDESMEDEEDVVAALVSEPHPIESGESGVSEEIDSDDKVIKGKLVARSSNHHQSTPRRDGQSHPRPSPNEDSEDEGDSADEDEDDIAWAKHISLTNPQPRSRATTRAPSVPIYRPPTAPIPGLSTPVRRQGSGGSTSSVPGVPLPGTRASEQKRRERESYVPPPGSRAAELAAAATTAITSNTRPSRGTAGPITRAMAQRQKPR
ncbi:hypothetical protein C8Q77DRAFT_1145464 [Trametes polyzona]|nr:hypothetical protein C8Q77DRAFT_1145464 [Trametes polyzona]